jgi:hypothetical protein
MLISKIIGCLAFNSFFDVLHKNNFTSFAKSPVTTKLYATVKVPQWYAVQVSDTTMMPQRTNVCNKKNIFQPSITIDFTDVSADMNYCCENIF